MTQSDTPAYKQLTQEIEPQTNGRDLLITLLSVFFILLLINFVCVWYLENYPQNRGYWLVNSKWKLLQNLEQPVEWLIVGDSSGNQGLDPSVLTAELGGTAVNLATVAGMGAVDDVWMLQTYIQRFGPPPNLIIIHTFDSWSSRLEMTLISKSNIPWLTWNNLQPELGFTFQQQRDIFLARFVPIYSENQSLSKAITRAFLQGKSLFSQNYRLQSDGFMPLHNPAPERVQREAQGRLRYVKNRQFAMFDHNQKAVAALISLAEQHDIQVYFAISPLYEGLFADERFQAYFNQLQEELHQLSAGHEHVHIIDEPITFPADQMENPDHVIDTAAKQYTQIIAATIEQLTSQTPLSRQD